MKSLFNTLILLLAIIFSAIDSNSQETTHVFENGNDKLIVYSDVPGLALSEFYTIRVRSNLTNNQWVDCAVLITRSLVSQVEEGDDSKHYFTHLRDWSHSYTNIEMNSAVEVEIAKVDGTAINKATVHPLNKGIATSIQNGKAYFTVSNPANLAIDIDGQMDDQDTGRNYDGPAIHTISLYANPVFDKPNMNDPGVVVVTPGETAPTNAADYTTLYFAPGVHDIGRGFPIYGNKQYFIPGDAIVYGNLVNTANGNDIKIFGVGTLSGDRMMHPQHDPEWPLYPDGNATPTNAYDWKGIAITDADNTLIEGISLSNPAFHSINLKASNNRVKSMKVQWTKIVTWKGNGDGIGSAHIVEDCFFRTQDDATYVKGDRRRCVFWNDANGATFVLAGMSDKFPIMVEDCDVLYTRASYHLWKGGRVFAQRAQAADQYRAVDVTFQNIRVEDKFPTMPVFGLWSKDDVFRWDGSTTGMSYDGITFKNITAAAESYYGIPNIFWGYEQAPWTNITFENVNIAGELFDSREDFNFDYDNDGVAEPYINEYVNITFKGGLSVDKTKLESMEFYPNPVNNGLLNISTSVKIDKLQVFDLTGKMVHQELNLDTNKQIDLSNLCKGLYLVHLTKNQSKVVRKVIVQ